MREKRRKDTNEIFLGRIEEQHRFREALRNVLEESRLTERIKASILRRAPAASPFTFLIYGEGGMGKSRLVWRLRDIALKEAPFKGRFKTIFLDWEQHRRLDIRLASREEVTAKTIFAHLYAAFCDAGFGRHFDSYRCVADEIDELEVKVRRAVGRKGVSGNRYEVAWEQGVHGFERVPSSYSSTTSTPTDQRRMLPLATDDVDLSVVRDLGESPELNDEERLLVAQPLETLGRRLAEGIHAASSSKPVIVFLDTYEIVDRADHWVRDVIKRAGPRVIWVIAGRDNLAQSRKYRDQYFTGYQHDFSSERLRLFQLGEFSVADVEVYFFERAPERPLDSENAKAIHAATLGIPLAVREAAAIWKSGNSILDIAGESPTRIARQQIVKTMTERFLLHCLNNPAEQASLYALALAYDADADLLAAMLQTQDLEADLSELERRYSFVFVDQMKLHHSVATFFREYLLQDIRRNSRAIRDINERAVLHLRARQQAREATFSLLESHFDDDRWIQLTLGLVHHGFWVNEDKGWAMLIPAFWAALIYNRGFARAVIKTVESFEPSLSKEGRERFNVLQGGLRFTRDPSDTASLVHEIERWTTVLENDVYALEFKFILDLLRAQLLHEEQNYAEALRGYERLLLRLPQNARKLRKELGEALGRVGWKLGYVKGFASANEDAARAYVGAMSCQETATRHRLLARIQLKLGQSDDSLKNGLRAVELEPGEAINYASLSETYARLARHEEAIAAVQRQINLDSRDAKGFAFLADLYDDLGRNDEAIAASKKAIELDPRCTKAYITLSSAYSRLNRPSDAQAAMQTAVEIDPNHAAAHFNLADLYLCRGEFEDASRELKERVRLHPANTFSPLVLLGLISRHGGQADSPEYFQRALMQWETAWTEHWQSSASLLELRSIALLSVGQNDEALKVICEAIRQMTAGSTINFSYWNLLETSPSPPDGIGQIIAILQQAEMRPQPTGTVESGGTQGLPPNK